MNGVEFESGDSQQIDKQTTCFYAELFTERALQTDRMMIWLLAAEWIGMIGAAAFVSPRVWNGVQSSMHPHLIAAIAAGPAFILPVIAIALLRPAQAFTRHAIAIAQILVSAILIDATGGRIETHFHLFGSLAFLAFYRDPKVLLTASLLTAADHFIRGIWWPQSVYGVLMASPWRWAEHAWWVVFEDIFLFLSIQSSVREARLIARNRATLYQGANHDVLTGLANRRLLKTKFDLATSQPDSRMALLFIDLDRFKHANDTLGHTVGDSLLLLVANRLQNVVGQSATLARVGGDEFVVLLEQSCGLDRSSSLGQRVLDCFTPPFQISSHQLMLTASVGISLFPDQGKTLPELQEKADQAMYIAKSRGRNRCVAFSSQVTRKAELAEEMGKDLSAVIKEQEVYLQ